MLYVALRKLMRTQNVKELLFSPTGLDGLTGYFVPGSFLVKRPRTFRSGGRTPSLHRPRLITSS